MPTTADLEIPDEAVPRALDRYGPYVAMVDESIKKVRYDPITWAGMDRIERGRHSHAYVVSAVQIRGETPGEARENARALLDELTGAAQEVFPGPRPFWHTTAAIAAMYEGTDDERAHVGRQVGRLCDAIERRCDYHMGVVHFPDPAKTSIPAYVGARQNAMAAALVQLNEPTPLIIADAINARGTMSAQRKDALVRGDIALVARLRQRKNAPAVFERGTQIRYASQWGSPLLWAADITAAAAQRHISGNNDLLRHLADDPRDVLTIINGPRSQVARAHRQQRRPSPQAGLDAQSRRLAESLGARRSRRAEGPAPGRDRPAPPPDPPRPPGRGTGGPRL